MKGINISQPIVNNAVDENYDALPNIDAIYGPYPNLNAAITTIMASKRAKGLTVGIMTDTGIEEYWFKMVLLMLILFLRIKVVVVVDIIFLLPTM